MQIQCWTIFEVFKLWRLVDSNGAVLEKLHSTLTDVAHVITTGRTVDASFDKF